MIRPLLSKSLQLVADRDGYACPCTQSRLGQSQMQNARAERDVFPPGIWESLVREQGWPGPWLRGSPCTETNEERKGLISREDGPEVLIGPRL